MQTLLATYAIAWVAVSACVTWLAVGNGRLARRVDRLEALLDERRDDSTPRANAA
jgi:hypothetical protein